MSDENCDFNTALKEAQEKGFAEADPTFDIEGIDSAHKIAVLTRLAYGTPVEFDDITVSGISGITLEDIECAREFGYRIKRSEEHTSELQSRGNIVCRLLLEKKKER